MSKVAILIVEDDLIIAAHISAIVKQSDYNVSEILTKGESALDYLSNNSVDVILMDIKLAGELNGIDTAKQIMVKYGTPVIFLTGNNDEATFTEAKEAYPFGFITKPFKNDDLTRTLELVLNKKGETPSESDTKPQKALKDRIFVRDKDRMVKLNIQDILYVEAERNYCKITTSEKSYILSVPLAKFEQKVPSNLFARIHRSHTVNIKAIEELNDNYVFINGKSFAISKSHKQDLAERLTVV